MNGYYEPYYGDSFWTTSEPKQSEATPQGVKDGHHINTFIVPIYQHGVLGEAPEEYYVNATDANGNTMAIKVDPNQTDVLPDVQFTRTVPFLGGIAATAGAEVVGGSTAAGTGISVTTAATTGGAVLVVGAAAAYSYDQRAAPTYESEHVAGYRSLTIPATEYVETYQPGETPFDEPVQLPSGSVYEPDAPVGDGHERGFGWEYIKRTPGINDYEDIGEILKAPNVVHEDGKYDLVIGETNDGNEILLRLLNGLVISASEVIRNPQAIDEPVKIPDDKSHFEGREQEHITDNSEIRRVIEQANEVYTNGHGLYVWVLYEHGEIKVVHAFDRSLEDGTSEKMFTVSTAYYVENGIDKWERIKESLQLTKVYPKDNE